MSASRKPAAPAHAHEAAEPVHGVRVGWIAGFDVQRGVLVDFPGSSGGPMPVRSVVPLDRSTAERAAKERQGAVLQFENGDPKRPVLMGLLQPAVQTPLLDAMLDAKPEEKKLEARVDGRKVAIEGREELVLRCGRASITLRRDGKVVVRGTYVETRATGTNRVKGGSVQIN